MSTSQDSAGQIGREQLIAQLEERARLLAVPDAVIAAALSRCQPGGTVTPEADAGSFSGPPAGGDLSRASPPAVAQSMTEAVHRMPQEIELGALSITPLSVTQIQPSGRLTSDVASERTVADSMVVPRPVVLGDTIPSGRIIAGYRIDRQIGSGAMGQVYRAVQLSVQRDVAFKVLTRRLAGNLSFRERFLREARAAGQLHHFNLIAVHDVGEADGLMFFSMELVDGQTVKDLLKRGPLPLAQALDISIQTLRALAYAHLNGIVHRDIKPDNLMVTSAGAVKVADLGLSRVDSLTRDTSATTQAGTLMGTPHYMSPEQGRDAHAADHRSDLYSVGATLYHMLYGQPPFTGKSPVEVVMRASTEPLVFPEPGPPLPVRNLLSKLLAKKPQDRYLSANEALHELEVLYQDYGPPVTDRQSLRRRRRRIKMRRMMPTVVMVAVAILVLSIFGALLVHFASGTDLLPAQRDAIQSALQTRDFRQALALIQADSAGYRPDSKAARALQELELQTRSAWVTDSQARVQALIAAFDAAVREERWGDAEKALHPEDGADLSPAAVAALQEKTQEFQQRLATLNDVPRTLGPVGKAFVHARATASAKSFWSQLLAIPDSAVQEIELGRSFNTAGNASLMPTDALALLPDGWRWGPGTLRAITLRQHFTSATTADESWSLKVGALQVVVSATGAILSRDNHIVESVASRDHTIRIERENNVTMMKLDNGTLVGTGVNNPTLEFHWSLAVGHRVEVVMHGDYARLAPRP